MQYADKRVGYKAFSSSNERYLVHGKKDWINVIILQFVINFIRLLYRIISKILN